jgi:hypothetical protein
LPAHNPTKAQVIWIAWARAYGRTCCPAFFDAITSDITTIVAMSIFGHSARFAVDTGPGKRQIIRGEVSALAEERVGRQLTVS